MVSSADGSSRAVPMPMAFIPPRWAASIPAAESSKTRHCSGGSPRASAPLRNTFGLGLPFTIFLPSITASKNAVISSFFRTNSAFLLTLPRAQPLFFGLRKGAVSLFQQNFQALCPADAQKGLLVCRSEGNSQFFGKLLPRPGVEGVSVHQNSVQIE